MKKNTETSTRILLRDPRREAELWLSLMPQWRPQDHLVILGIGQAYHIQEVEKKGLYASLHLVDLEAPQSPSFHADFHLLSQVKAGDLPLPLMVLPFRPAWRGNESLFSECFLRITGRRDRSLRSEFGEDARQENLRLILQELVR